MDLNYAVSLGGAAILVSILVEAVKRALDWQPAQVERFGPLCSISVGVFIVLALNVILGMRTAEALATAVVTGIIAGAAASGLYDAAPQQLKRLLEA